jgi:glycosyltransferase involved in cell wall biosynthesis
MDAQHILADLRWQGSHGIARFASEIYARLPVMKPVSDAIPLFHPLDPLWLTSQIKLRGCKAFFTPGFNAPLVESVPIVLTVHDLNYVHFPDNSDFVRRAYFRYVVRPACRRAHKVLTVSEFSRGQIIQWAGIGPGTVENVGCGARAAFRVAEDRYEPGFPYILAIGNERPHKNIPRLIRAFAAARLPGDMRLLISGKVGQEVMGILSELRLEQAVHLIGHVPEEDLPRLYRGALALCMPSLFEGFGLPVIEAMACGTPVLTSTAASLPEIAGPAAILVDPTDVDAIAAGLNRIVSDEQTRAELIQRGIVRASQFSWDRTAQQVAAVLAGLN